MRTPALFDVSPRFAGPSFNPAVDQVRLTKQMGRVCALMSDGQWRTLDGIAKTTGDPHASISAQLRASAEAAVRQLHGREMSPGRAGARSVRLRPAR
jgi:hypothetical protein